MLRVTFIDSMSWRCLLLMHRHNTSNIVHAVQTTSAFSLLPHCLRYFYLHFSCTFILFYRLITMGICCLRKLHHPEQQTPTHNFIARSHRLTQPHKLSHFHSRASFATAFFEAVAVVRIIALLPISSAFLLFFVSRTILHKLVVGGWVSGRMDG